MDTILVNVFETAKAHSLVIFADALRAVQSEKEVVLESADLLGKEVGNRIENSSSGE